MDDKKQMLLDPGIKPTEEIIAEALGVTNAIYVQWIEQLKHRQVTLMEWRYYHDAKSWLSKGEYHWKSVRGKDRVTPNFWLSIWDGFFKVTFFFSEKTMYQILALPLSPEAKEMIQNTQLSGKKTKYLAISFDVKSKEQLQDLYILTEFRKEQI